MVKTDKKATDGTTKGPSKTASKSTVKGSIGGLVLSRMARGGANLLTSNAEAVNKLNVFPVPDGDTGDNMRMTIESGIAAIENMDSDDLAAVMKTLSHGMLLGARGNSGVILSQFFSGIAKGLEKFKTADAKVFGHALELGVQQAYSSVMTPTEGTILTVAREAVEYAVANITPESTIRSLFSDLVNEMHASLDRTPERLAVLKEAGVVDSGGAGLLYIMEGFNRVLNGEDADEYTPAPRTAAAPALTSFSFDADSEMTYGYCTELLLQLQNAKIKAEAFDIALLRQFLMGIGDSVVAFQTDSIVKLHVHTFTPEKVLEFCRKFGEFLTVKIENMSLQHTELTDKEKEPETKANMLTQPPKKYGIVAVSNGPGIEKLFYELGVDAVVQGGQTQNPSTSDFFEAFQRIQAEHIFVFPNNANIIMAAEQAAGLYDKAKVHVLPSKNIGTGYVAISAANMENEDEDAIVAEMTEAMRRVTAGYVSPSIRNANIQGIQIHCGDTMGILEKEIVVSEPNKMAATEKLVSRLLNLPDKCMLTVFTGKDVTEAEIQKLDAYIKECHPDAEFYFIDGGQDIYPYIFVAE